MADVLATWLTYCPNMSDVGWLPDLLATWLTYCPNMSDVGWLPDLLTCCMDD
jgi:hypothetical protein